MFAQAFSALATERPFEDTVLQLDQRAEALRALFPFPLFEHFLDHLQR
jgi:hypothetical protein